MLDNCLKKIFKLISEFKKGGWGTIQNHFVSLPLIYEKELKYCVIQNPLCSKKNTNKIQGHAFEIFRVTFIVEHTQ